MHLRRLAELRKDASVSVLVRLPFRGSTRTGRISPAYPSTNKLTATSKQPPSTLAHTHERVHTQAQLAAVHRSFLENFTAVAAAYGSADVFMHVYYDPADPSHMRALRKFAEMPNVKAIVAEARNHALAVRHTLCTLAPGLPTFSHSGSLASSGCRSGARNWSASLRLNTTRSSGG